MKKLLIILTLWLGAINQNVYSSEVMFISGELLLSGGFILGIKTYQLVNESQKLYKQTGINSDANMLSGTYAVSAFATGSVASALIVVGTSLLSLSFY